MESKDDVKDLDSSAGQNEQVFEFGGPWASCSVPTTPFRVRVRQSVECCPTRRWMHAPAGSSEL